MQRAPTGGTAPPPANQLADNESSPPSRESNESAGPNGGSTRIPRPASAQKSFSNARKPLSLTEAYRIGRGRGGSQGLSEPSSARVAREEGHGPGTAAHRRVDPRVAGFQCQEEGGAASWRASGRRHSRLRRRRQREPSIAERRLGERYRPQAAAVRRGPEPHRWYYGRNEWHLLQAQGWAKGRRGWPGAAIGKQAAAASTATRHLANRAPGASGPSLAATGSAA